MFCILLSSISPAYSHRLGYDYLIDLGKRHLESKEYTQALHYFELAQLADPEHKEAGQYINLIKRIFEGRVIAYDEVEEMQKEILYRKKQQEYQLLSRQEEKGRFRDRAVIRDLDRQERLKEDRGMRKLEKAEKEKAEKREDKPRRMVLEELTKIERDREQVVAMTDKELLSLEILERIEKNKARAASVVNEELSRLEELMRKDKKSRVGDGLAPSRIEKKEDRWGEGIKPLEIKSLKAGKKDELSRKLVSSVNLNSIETPAAPLNLQIAIDKPLSVKAREIKRFLVVVPDILLVEKISSSELKVTGLKSGETFLHIWDSEGRKTLNIKVVYSHEPSRKEEKKQKMWEDVEGFKFRYNTNWRSYYKGAGLSKIERSSLGFSESLSASGLTPYGRLGGNFSWARYNKKMELGSYNFSLTQGRLWDFKDFSIRGPNVSESFSSFTLPGKSLRGFVLKSPAFDKKLDYTFIHGKEEQSYNGSLSPEVSQDLDSFIEGLKVNYTPSRRDNFSFNYVHGRGAGRAEYLPDSVFSLQSRHNWDKLSFSTELASDMDHIAATLSSSYKLPKANLSFGLRNIEKDFSTIAGRSSGSGRLGVQLGAGWRALDKLYISSNLDTYRDRATFNQDDPKAWNYNWSNSLNLTLNETSSFSTSIYYNNTPGSSSPYQSVNISNRYSKRFNPKILGGKSLSTYLGYSYYRSKYELSSSSDHRKDTVSTGLRFPLLKDLSYYLNCSWGWEEALASGEKSESRVMDTGVSYRKKINPLLSLDSRAYYRNEEKKSGSVYSSLAGEDSLEGNINLTFTPKKDNQIYLDTRARNVWPQNSDNDSYVELSLRIGTRLSWDSFINFAPKTRIQGFVFNDANGDGIRDSGETGISDIKLTIGPKEVVSNEKGEYDAVVKAKSVIAYLDINSVPEGYVFTTPVSFEVNTVAGGVKNLNFGLSLQSGIYGVVFYDANNDGQLDKGDLPIQGVKVKLNNKIGAVTNNKGVYFFSDVTEGKNVIRLDVNSLPIEYLPKVSVKKEVEITEGITFTYNIPLTRSGK